MRLNRQRLDFTQNAFGCVIDIRFEDIDTLRHINNVAAIGMLQECRVRFKAAHEFAQNADVTFVIAGLHVEFARELLYPGAVNGSIVVLEIGRTSFRFGQVLR